jgi:phospholipase C
MTDFAIESKEHNQLVLRGASFSFGFGPASPGRLHVILNANQATLSVAPQRRAAGPGVDVASARTRPLATPRRQGIGPRRPHTDLGDLLDGELAPPDDFVPPLRIDPAAFTIDVLDATGTTVGSGAGPLLSLDVPEPPPLLGGAVLPPLVVRDTWQIRVTNNSSLDAYAGLEVRFHGQRPILSKPYELDFLNDRFDALFNTVQPLRIRFENRIRVVGLPQIETWFVVDAIESWERAHASLRELEFNLGERVLRQVTESTEITVRACVHDGAPAIRARVRFRPGAGSIDLLNLLAMRSAGWATVGELIIGLTPADRPVVEIHRLELDVFFVLRPSPEDQRGSFQIIAQPTLETGSVSLIGLEVGADTSTAIARAFAQAVFELSVPAHLGDALTEFARMFATWLLGDRDRELAGGVERLDINYVGDAPRPEVVAPTTISPTRVPLNPGNLSKIDHIVVVMMENRSFDHMLGYLSLPTSGAGDVTGLGRSDVDGLKGNEFNFSGLKDNQTRHIFPLSRPWTGPTVPPQAHTRPTRFLPDPGHSFADTLVQRGGFDVELRPSVVVEPGEPPEPAIVVHLGPNAGFVYNFADRLSSQVENLDGTLLRELAGEVMGYHPGVHVPTYDFLARHYAVCDRWFAAHPGHTWPNRFVSLTGRLATDEDGRPQIDNPDFETFDPLETPTIVDHLLNAGISCRYYEHDFCMLRVFSRYTFDDTVIAPIDDPARGFFAAARNGQLPSVSFVEPDLTGIDVGNDDHPPADITDGQRFLNRVYDALASGPAAQWRGTLLLITYDEHGGFFDHVHPEPHTTLFDSAAPLSGGFVPIAFEPGSTEPITHYGMRVPALVVSPWVREASVSSTVFDHTSILKTIIATFLTANPPDMGWRVAHADHVGPLLSRPQPQRPRRAPPAPTVAQRVLLRSPRRSAAAVPAEREFRDFIRGFRDRVRMS